MISLSITNKDGILAVKTNDDDTLSILIGSNADFEKEIKISLQQAFMVQNFLQSCLESWAVSNAGRNK
jgi:hypothetical protein